MCLHFCSNEARRQMPGSYQADFGAGERSSRMSSIGHFSEVPQCPNLGPECTPKRTSIDRSESMMRVAEISSALSVA